jgi:thiamine transporter ThiT
MLGLLILFFIAKAFYTLADKHGRNKWVFGILSIAIYYGSAFLGGMLIGIIAIAMGNESIFELSDMALNLIALPFGLLAVGLTYYLLKRNWERNPRDTATELLDDTHF